MVVAFLAQMEKVLMTHPTTCVFNMDEISWRLVNNQMSTLAEISAEAVECLLKGDPKMGLTTLASVDDPQARAPLGSVQGQDEPLRSALP
jgi:hypothetical protein